MLDLIIGMLAIMQISLKITKQIKINQATSID
jgi:hypothetical protein